MRRRVAFGSVALLIVALASFFVGWRLVRDTQLADLHTPQELPLDVEVEVGVVWDDFLDVFGARRRCFADVELLLVSDVADGDARYVIPDRRIEIQIPTSPVRFRDSLAHELAHHLEHTCAAFDELKQPFTDALGSPAASWDGGDVWEERPSELYAEAVVQLVTGERARHLFDMPLPPEAIAAVRRWAQ